MQSDVMATAFFSSCIAVSQFRGCSLQRTWSTWSAKAASFVDWDGQNRALLNETKMSSSIINYLCPKQNAAYIANWDTIHFLEMLGHEGSIWWSLQIWKSAFVSNIWGSLWSRTALLCRMWCNQPTNAALKGCSPWTRTQLHVNYWAPFCVSCPVALRSHFWSSDLHHSFPVHYYIHAQTIQLGELENSSQNLYLRLVFIF